MMVMGQINSRHTPEIIAVAYRQVRQGEPLLGSGTQETSQQNKLDVKVPVPIADGPWTLYAHP